MHATRVLLVNLIAAGLAVAAAAPAHAGLIDQPTYRDAFDDDVCGTPAHVVIRADNPVVDTGRVMQDGELATVNSGHLQIRFTNLANGHWMEDDFSGPATAISAVENPDGTVTKRVVFSGIKREFLAWDGSAAVDRGRLVVDYVLIGDEIVNRSEVSRVGTFPIASGDVTFCGFAEQHLA